MQGLAHVVAHVATAEVNTLALHTTACIPLPWMHLLCMLLDRWCKLWCRRVQSPAVQVVDRVRMYKIIIALEVGLDCDLMPTEQGSMDSLS